MPPNPDPTPEPPNGEDEKGPKLDGKTLWFYEGEEPKKADLTAHLTVWDKEDKNLINQVKIKKITYGEGALKKGYTVTWEDDIPKDYIFDTYYLKMKKDEIITHKVTYEVTDSAGNTTTAELPVKVRYNYPPEIDAPEVYYYFKEDANSGKIDESELLKNALATDKEDGKRIADKLKLVDFDPEKLKMQTESTAAFEIHYQVTDSLRKTTDRKVKIVITDPAAKDAEQKKQYTRFISDKYLDTFEPTSVWREPENMKYLKQILENEAPMDTWYFKHEDVLRVQDWITEEGDGHWKMGQEANQEFYRMFSGCRQ